MTNIERFVKTQKWFRYVWGKTPELPFMTMVDRVFLYASRNNKDPYDNKQLLEVLKEMYESSDK